MSTSLGTNLGAALSSVTTIYLTDGDFAILVTANTTPETQAGVYQKGCLCIRTDNGTLYSNTGTTASPSWTVNGVGAQGSMGSQGSLGPTGPQGTQGTQGSQGSQGTG